LTLSLETVTDYDKTTYLGFTPLVGTSSGSDLLGIKSEGGWVAMATVHIKMQSLGKGKSTPITFLYSM